jgi:hypothetical protein
MVDNQVVFAILFVVMLGVKLTWPNNFNLRHSPLPPNGHPKGCHNRNSTPHSFCLDTVFLLLPYLN